MTAEEEEQARRDKRWAKLLAAPPAGVGPIGALAGMMSPSQAHTIEEQRRERDTGSTLAASGRRMDLDLDRGTVTIHPPAPRGETYRRPDGTHAFRLKAGNGTVVATARDEGHPSRAEARTALARLMGGAEGVAEVHEQDDGTFGFRITASDGEVLAIGGGVPFTSAAAAQAAAEMILAGAYAGVIVDR